MKVFKWFGVRLVNMTVAYLLTGVVVVIMLGIIQVLIWSLFGYHVDGLVDNVFTQPYVFTKLYTATNALGVFPVLISLFWDKLIWQRGLFH